MICAVIGGQFGSEGKGVIVSHLADRFQIHVRVGAPNAGHSIYHQGKIWKMRSVPCGWINPEAHLVIGIGALIDMQLLKEEVYAIAAIDPTIWERLHVDVRAGVLSRKFRDFEGGVDGVMHRRIGSTGEGVGPARVARINRNPNEFKFFEEEMHDYSLGTLAMNDTSRYLDDMRRAGADILLEGSQGVGLSLYHGDWPYVTSVDCGVAAMCSEIGIAPAHVSRVVCVFRTFPIRVAGNSGPMHNEITWEQLSQATGKQLIERTTVTNKVRRIGEWDMELAKKAIRLNSPTSVALTFLDYVFPEEEGLTRWSDLTSMCQQWIRNWERKLGEVRTSLIGTGGTPWQVMDVGEL